MKTAKKNRHCISVQNVVEKYQHTLQLHIENFYERNKIAGATAQPTDKIHGERLLHKQNTEN